MAVLIEGMKIPFTCLTCDFHKCAGGVGDFCSLTKRRQFRFKNRPKDCPLIEVPEPHGRLGDLDELKTAFPCGEYVKTESVRATIDHMRTIIPASEEGEA